MLLLAFTIFPIPLQQCFSSAKNLIKWLKLTVELSNIQMAVLKDAFEKARKESGLKDRASLLEYIAKVFLQGVMPAPKKHSKPSYQIVIHRHLPSNLTWCNTPKGERPVPPEILEKALIDAEIVELDEPDELDGPPRDQNSECPPRDQNSECPPRDQNPERPPRDQNNDKETSSGEMEENVDRQKADVQKEAQELLMNSI